MAANSQRNGQGMALRMAIRGELMVNRRRHNRNRMHPTFHPFEIAMAHDHEKSRPKHNWWAALKQSKKRISAC